MILTTFVINDWQREEKQVELNRDENRKDVKKDIVHRVIGDPKT